MVAREVGSTSHLPVKQVRLQHGENKVFRARQQRHEIADADAAFTDEQIDEIFRHLNVDAGAGLSVVELSFIGLLTKTDSETSGGV